MRGGGPDGPASSGITMMLRKSCQARQALIPGPLPRQEPREPPERERYLTQRHQLGYFGGTRHVPTVSSVYVYIRLAIRSVVCGPVRGVYSVRNAPVWSGLRRVPRPAGGGGAEWYLLAGGVGYLQAHLKAVVQEGEGPDALLPPS
jgi:hypothetical protein